SLGLAEGFVPLLSAGESPQGPYLVMPLIRGGTLHARLERGRLEVDDAVAIVRTLARAIGSAHALGLVHRDLKPENVLFGEDGRPLIVDLGLAKHWSPDAPGASQSVSVTRHGALLGTPGYMAPEQIEDPRAAGPGSDV